MTFRVSPILPRDASGFRAWNPPQGIRAKWISCTRDNQIHIAGLARAYNRVRATQKLAGIACSLGAFVTGYRRAGKRGEKRPQFALNAEE